MMYLRFMTIFPRNTADWSSVLTEVFELCQCFDSQGLSTATILSLLHVLKVNLLNVHGVVLFQHCLSFLDQPSHCPFEHILLTSLPV